MATVTLEEVWALFKETDRKFQETDRKFQETERLIKETALANAQAAEKRTRELERTLYKKIGELGDRLGDFAEGFVRPAVVRLFRERGIEVHKVTRKIEANNPQLNLATEIDLLVINGDSCVLVEVKSNVSIDDVNEHIERMAKFKPLFPEYADKKAFGAMAGMVISENVAKYAYRKGFFVIAQQGDLAVILNDNKFQPATW
ncbi:MAG: hypothetical protein RIT27_610 [Pseudomonadota bacterium]|jgi:hypothetical protein